MLIYFHLSVLNLKLINAHLTSWSQNIAYHAPIKPNRSTIIKRYANATLTTSTLKNIATKVQTVSPAPLNPPAIISCED